MARTKQTARRSTATFNRTPTEGNEREASLRDEKIVELDDVKEDLEEFLSAFHDRLALARLHLSSVILASVARNVPAIKLLIL